MRFAILNRMGRKIAVNPIKVLRVEELSGRNDCELIFSHEQYFVDDKFLVAVDELNRALRKDN